MIPHVRVVLPRMYDRSTGELKPGAKRITNNDQILVIGEDGEEIDISTAVSEWSTAGKVGEAATLKLTLYSFEIERPEVEPRVEAATAAPGEFR